MAQNDNYTDVLLIGAGIMSATLGSLMMTLDDSLKVELFESLDAPGKESSNAWNNAGTGHAAFCELNYTKETSDGAIEVKKAIEVNEQFQVSRQYWSHLVKSGLIENPESFIRTVPHLSFVGGADNVKFLKNRVEALREHPLFEGMEYSDDKKDLEEWIPLMMKGRDASESVAATRIQSGTDVNFGALTSKMISHIEAYENVNVNYRHAVIDLKQIDGLWRVKVKDLENGTLKYYTSKFVFIGAGGASIQLLQNSGIPEARNIGGFPVSGLFLVCNKDELAEQHLAKVYGKAKVGAPPMSAPHLDTRYVDGKKYLLFGPFAGFSTKFLKNGTYLDLITSVKPYNIATMLAAGGKEMALTKYLISQVMQSHEQRIEDLREFVPTAKSEDWDIITAGQRVQIIKDTEEKGKGTLQFGTEVISSSDGTIAALLGASPGASVCVDVMLSVLERSFSDRMAEWEPKIKEMIPSYKQSLSDNPELFREVQKDTSETLNLASGEDGVLLS